MTYLRREKFPHFETVMQTSKFLMYTLVFARMDGVDLPS